MGSLYRDDYIKFLKTKGIDTSQINY
jgi:hypothetical protein